MNDIHTTLIQYHTSNLIWIVVFYILAIIAYLVFITFMD